MKTYEEELLALAQEGDRRMAALHEKYRDKVIRGRDGPASVEEREINLDICSKIKKLCKKYGRDTI